MPTTVFSDMEVDSTIVNHRTLQLALELSMFGVKKENESLYPSIGPDERRKMSQNTTECVPVPTSEHVAEIVGRQGCKIKALRAKTNTYIKTPVRGEEPVFVVTGRKEDVCWAKGEIISAAEHFSHIRAQRKNMNGPVAVELNCDIPGQTTVQVRVPYRVVGLVVGSKGATIKRIQQQTNTYIVTPSRDKEPVFEITGPYENVESAKYEIETHIAMRTGKFVEPCGNNIFYRNGADQDFQGNSKLEHNAMNSPYTLKINQFGHSFHKSNNLHKSSQEKILKFLPENKIPNLTDFSYTGGFTNINELYDSTEGLRESSLITTQLTPRPEVSLWSEIGNLDTTPFLRNKSLVSFSSHRNNSINGDNTSLADSLAFSHQSSRQIGSDSLSLIPLFPSLPQCATNRNSNDVLPNCTSSVSSSSTDSFGSGGPKGKQECIVCSENNIVAALIPCGHNLFCLECANRICEKTEPECPICHQFTSQAIRIYN
ncbi:RNA-binding protein MEX3B-like [Limulus polyphemus]|uniref:RNA-binding protein MEX3B-like n=1 Tax=Limulus polyphemus TaxID=6850 RepID=A0ABM1B4X7_LIMPO|nr:RNA-binding protein MEX3B-like [Limulus polyphemus]